MFFLPFFFLAFEHDNKISPISRARSFHLGYDAEADMFWAQSADLFFRSFFLLTNIALRESSEHFSLGQRLPFAKTPTLSTLLTFILLPLHFVYFFSFPLDQLDDHNELGNLLQTE